jgi:hypothetical protein
MVITTMALWALLSLGLALCPRDSTLDVEE